LAQRIPVFSLYPVKKKYIEAAGVSANGSGKKFSYQQVKKALSKKE
jgi:hypothetical protein